MNKRFKELPKFKNEDEERNFWATHDSTDYFDWSKAKRVIFPNLQLTKRPISLRITNSLLAKVKMIANKKDMPYQTLMKQYVSKGVEQEFTRA
ncbi:MAG: BrnA antitoxin family protein [Patescibacteria group bacterium]